MAVNFDRKLLQLTNPETAFLKVGSGAFFSDLVIRIEREG